MRLFTVAVLTILLSASCGQKSGKQAQSADGLKVTFLNNEADKKVDILVGERLLTSYNWTDSVFKPFLYPIMSLQLSEVTRGFPIKPRENERTDHPHQIGNWLTYGNVNGWDFWGNGSRGLGIPSPNGGIIKHISIESQKEGEEGVMITNESWRSPLGNELLKERTEYHFMANGNARIIDRITTLTATDSVVKFADTKEGMFGIRVARQLELPSKEDIKLKEKDGSTTTVKALSNDDVTGNYHSSEGIEGEAVWSTRAKWMHLFGIIRAEKISIVICDHPKNVSYPTYWHARGYGLFAANPLGVKDFTGGKEELNFTLQPGQSVTFRYRIVVNSGDFLTDPQINDFTNEFAKKYN